MPINNPIPSSLQNECRKAARILTSFVDPRQSFGPDKIIPPSVLANAKGLAILTVAKIGFLLTARAGSGLVVARRPDGSWSAPAAIGTAGAGFGSQLGAELTDFVMILNDAKAVKTFAQAGSLTLGGNVSVAAGPVGRNAEASGAASLRSIAGIFSYSKTKGLFAGVSLEGSIIVERKDANSKFYGTSVSARQLLSGTIQPPPEAEALISILGSRVFSRKPYSDNYYDVSYNDIPTYDERPDDREAGSYSRHRGSSDSLPRRAATWDNGSDKDNTYWDRFRTNKSATFDFMHESGSAKFQKQHFDSTYSDDVPSQSLEQMKTPPGRPTAQKPIFKPTQKSYTLDANQAIALYTFQACQDGDLGFKKGDIVTIIKRTDSKNDWWTGQINGKTGIFPSNYVETI